MNDHKLVPDLSGGMSGQTNDRELVRVLSVGTNDRYVETNDLCVEMNDKTNERELVRVPSVGMNDRYVETNATTIAANDRVMNDQSVETNMLRAKRSERRHPDLPATNRALPCPRVHNEVAQWRSSGDPM